MGLPAKRRTSRSKRERAAHFALKAIIAGKCEKCGAPKRPHYACAKCGTYKGKVVLNVEKRASRRQRREKKIK